MNKYDEVDAILAGFAQSVGPKLSAAIFLAKTVPGQTGSPQEVLLQVGWTAVQQELQAQALLPRELTEHVFAVVPLQFMEDDAELGRLTGVVAARSDGWDFVVSFFEQFLLQATAGGLVKVGIDLADIEDDLGQLQDQVQDHIGQQEIPGQFFGPVQIDDELWSQVTFSGESVEKVEHNSYKPVAVGQTTLRIQVPPDEGGPKFGGSEEAESFPIEVAEIEIRLEPGDTVLEPGIQATFRVIVENSKFPELIHEEAAEGTMLQGVLDGLTFGADDSVTLDYIAPPNPDFDDPDEIQVRSVSTTGARAAANAPPRFGTATVRFAKVEVSPGDLFCRPLSSEQDFTAEVMGPDDKSVTWTVDEGMIDQNGHYIAPPERPASGMATVRATSNAYPEIFDEVTFTVGCTCTYTLTLEGETIAAQPGDVLSFTTAKEDPDPVRRLIGVSARRPSESWEAFLLPPDADVESRPDAAGIWPVRVQGDMGLSQPDIIWASGDEDAEVAFVDLKEFRAVTDSTTGVIQGVITNHTVGIVSTVTPRPATFAWSFAIELELGQFQCTVPDPGGG